MAKALSPKLREWLKFYLDSSNPKTFGNRTESARQAGYKCSNRSGFENVGSQNYRRLQPQIEAWFDENELSPAKLKELLTEGLTAMETKFFHHQGEVTEEREVIPWAIRHKYLETALRVRGLFEADNLQKIDTTLLKSILDALPAELREQVKTGLIRHAESMKKGRKK